jgi:hypothetical protein
MLNAPSRTGNAVGQPRPYRSRGAREYHPMQQRHQGNCGIGCFRARRIQSQVDATMAPTS